MSNGVAMLLEQVLSEQAEMSAVELFSELHELALVGEVGLYRHLMPASPPAPGQQYGFEVDLDSCTGCKACVTACHRRNGLDEGESWRSAGPLEACGPQVVTTACHHCVEPACLAGCPVNAYEKEAATGIVVHLDDQCIGCGYCLMTCPYEVPRFNERLGIVRKCDMCRGRLAAGEPPACVEACPNGAIRISVVDVGAQRRAAAEERFLAGAPAPSRTVPSTVYRSERGAGKGAAMRPMLADGTPPIPAPAEVPLVITLVLSQLASGTALAGAICDSVGGPIGVSLPIGLALLSLVLGLGAIAGSVTHLGRPQYAWRAVLGWRHSWLSREVLSLGAFLALGTAWTGVELAGHRLGGLEAAGAVLGWATAGTGLGVIACSVMVYAVTGRWWWRASMGLARFGCTAALGALAGTGVVVALPRGARGPGAGLGTGLALALLGAAGLVLGGECLLRRRLRRGAGAGLFRSAEGTRTAELLGRPAIRSLGGWRLGCTIGGALLLGDALALAAPGAGRVLALAGLGLLVVGELIGRGIVFMAVAPARMPGGRL